uniref:Uncharacterized protein n=1 Tax=Lepeophtheirus salmonis TaxID=72036 RepID=A0A0K2UZG3_LEPSM
MASPSFFFNRLMEIQIPCGRTTTSFDLRQTSNQYIKCFHVTWHC